MKRRIFLTRRKQFARVARLGKSSGGGWGRLRFVANKKKAARLGVSVSKKWVRRAVKRNRLRRLLRETFRQQWRADLPPADILFCRRRRTARR